MRPMSLVAAALLCSMLSACSGGGGGGTANNGGNGGFNVSLGNSAITFEYMQGQQPAPQTVTATWTGTPPDPVYLGATIEGEAIQPNIPILLSETGARASIQPRAGLAPGQYTGRILFLVCTDPACNNRVGGSPLPISYTVRVRTPLFTPVTLTSFDYTVGSPPPAAQAIDITASNWTATASASWIRLSASSGAGPASLTISLDPQGLNAGEVNGSVTVTSGGETQVLTVLARIRAPDLSAGVGELSFSGFTGEVPQPQPLTLSTQNSLPAAWTATANVPWIALSATGGTTQSTITVATPDAPTLASGSYQGEILFSATIAGTVKTTRVRVRLTLQRPVLTLSSEQLSFSAVNGATIAARSVTITSPAPAGLVTLAAAASTPWIQFDRTTGSAPETFAIGADPSIGPLASGSYQGTVRFTATSGVDVWTVDMPVSLALTRPVLTANPASMVLGGDAGRTFDQLPLTLSLNTGSNGYAWTASQSGAGTWLQTTASGTASAAGSTVLFTPVRAGVEPGTHDKNVTFRAQVNGDVLTTSVPVTFNLDTHKLLALENGIAFTSTPLFSRLTRTVPIVSNFDLPIGWTATSNQPWLTVTPTGVGGGSIVLTADPTALATDSLSIATVTIAVSGSDPAESETIQVGLWKGSTTPNTRQIIAATDVRHAVADPIRPYVHVNSRGNEVRTFNIYTGQEVLPAIVLPTTMAWEMAAHTDGSLLWVVSPLDNRMIPIDLATHAVLTSRVITFDDHGLGQSLMMAYGRINGVSMVFPEVGSIHAADTGQDLGSTGLGYAAFTGDGKKAFGSSLRIDLDYTDAHGGRFTREFVGGVPVPVTITDEVATNLDGSRVYFPAGDAYNVAVYDGNLLSLLPRIEPRAARFNNIDVARDGRVAIGSEAFPPDTENLWLYRADGTLIASWHNANGVNAFLNPRTIVFSSDGNFIVVPAGNVLVYPAPQ